jgi:hypothetical protein
LWVRGRYGAGMTTNQHIEPVPVDSTWHEAHGRCGNCGNAVHRYPFGWQHVGCGMHSCPNLAPVATCCDAHAAYTARYDRPAGA